MDKFVSPVALPTSHEREILTILIEECAEVQQRATKLLRFGRDEVQEGQPLTNAQQLSREVADLEVMVDMAQSLGLISVDDFDVQKDRKRAKLAKYMQTSAPAPHDGA